MKSCIDCKYFMDGHYSKVYISPTCTQRGQDSAAYMRRWICGIDEAMLYEPKTDELSTPKQPGHPITETGEGIEHEQFNREAK